MITKSNGNTIRDQIKHLSLYLLIHSVSQIFAAIMFVDDCGTKNPYQNSLSLCRRQNWKPVKILGREIDSAAQHKQKSMGSPVCWTVWAHIQFRTYIIVLQIVLPSKWWINCFKYCLIRNSLSTLGFVKFYVHQDSTSV